MADQALIVQNRCQECFRGATPAGAFAEAACKTGLIWTLHAASVHLVEGQQQTEQSQLQLPMAMVQSCLEVLVTCELGAGVLHVLLAKLLL